VEGAPLALTLESSQSTLALSGTFENELGETLPLVEQAPGSLVAHFQGSALVDMTGATLALEVLADAIQLPGEYFPAWLDPDPQGADLAGAVVNPVVAQQGAYAVRELALQLASLPITMNPAGEFAVTSVLCVGEADRTFFTGTLGSGGVSFHTTSTIFENNESALLGRFEQVGSLLVLTIPVDLPWTISAGTTALQATSGRLTGQIVATALVPEPSTIALLVIGGVLLLGIRFRTAVTRAAD